MSDVIRLDLTPEEAKAVKAALHGLKDFSEHRRAVSDKLWKAEQNPLNGPTFKWDGNCPRCRGRHRTPIAAIECGK